MKLQLRQNLRACWKCTRAAPTDLSATSAWASLVFHKAKFEPEITITASVHALRKHVCDMCVLCCTCSSRWCWISWNLLNICKFYCLEWCVAAHVESCWHCVVPYLCISGCCVLLLSNCHDWNIDDGLSWCDPTLALSWIADVWHVCAFACPTYMTQAALVTNLCFHTK